MNNIFSRVRDLLEEQDPAVQPADLTANGQHTDDLPALSAASGLSRLTPPVIHSNGNGHIHTADWSELLGTDSSLGALGDDDSIHLDNTQIEFVTPTKKRQQPKAKTEGSRRHTLLLNRRKAVKAEAARQRERAIQRARQAPRRGLFTERQYNAIQNPQIFRAKTRARLVRRVGTKVEGAVRIHRIEQAVIRSRTLTKELRAKENRNSTTKVRWVQRAKVARYLLEQARGEQWYTICHHEPRVEADEVMLYDYDGQPAFRCAHCEFVSFDGNQWVHPTQEVEQVRGLIHEERPRRHFHLMSEDDVAALTNRPVGHCGQQTKCRNVTVNGHRWSSSMRKFELRRFGRPSLFRRNQQYGTLPRHRPEPDAEKGKYMRDQEDVLLTTRWWFPELIEDGDGGWIADPDSHYAWDRADFQRVTYHSEFGFIPEAAWDYLDEVDEVAAADFDNLSKTISFVVLVFDHHARLPEGLMNVARQRTKDLFDSGNLALLMEVDRTAISSLVKSLGHLPKDEVNRGVLLAAAKFIQSVQGPARKA